MQTTLSYLIPLLIVTAIITLLMRRNSSEPRVSLCWFFSVVLTMYAAYSWIFSPFMAVGFLTMKGRTMSALDILQGDFPPYCDLTFHTLALTAVVWSGFGILCCFSAIKARSNVLLRIFAGATLLPLLYAMAAFANNGVSAETMGYFIGDGFTGVMISMILVAVIGGGFGISTPPTQEPSVPPPEPKPREKAETHDPEEEDIHVPKTWVCPKCGATNPLGKFVCLSCGTYK